ncbi:hypothetical protein KC727_00375 [Candidatus Kaiserbacteria bacterium]|nr:hypothetical protein [Candidatus Kaiserbacteria bacterium]
MAKKKSPAEVFQDLLQEKSQLRVHVPGVENGLMDKVLEALNNLDDKDIVEVIRAAR